MRGWGTRAGTEAGPSGCTDAMQSPWLGVLSVRAAPAHPHTTSRPASGLRVRWFAAQDTGLGLCYQRVLLSPA